jgi:hypothetical protein
MISKSLAFYFFDLVFCYLGASTLLENGGVLGKWILGIFQSALKNVLKIVMQKML